MPWIPHNIAVRQISARKNQGRKPPIHTKETLGRPPRRSARLGEIRRKKSALQGFNKERERLLSYSNIREKGQNSRRPPRTPHRKRKRSQNTEEPHDCTSTRGLQKRARISAAGAAVEDTWDQGPADIASEDNRSPVAYWTQHGRWPEEYFEEGSTMSSMSNILARKRSATSLARKNSDSDSATPSSTTPSDEKQREAKSADYKHGRYETLLATKGSFMKASLQGVTVASKNLCKILLENEQTSPRDSLFRDDLFESTCETIRNRNETRVIRDIALLIVPSAEILTIYGAANLQCLIESVNEGWNNSIPVTKTRPQPDYAVGFRRESFTEEQLNKIQPFVGELTDLSHFMATYYMYFPFLTCEAKCGAAALDIADRQNAHSMTLAVRAVVELFKLAKREKEVDREILAFSISHDHCSVRIYGHYAVLDGPQPTYYRHPIHKFDFTALDGKEKWTAYKFTKNVYDNWMPTHFKRICSVIDEFPPDVNFDVSQQSELQFTEKSGMSQDLETYSLAPSSGGSGSAHAQGDNQSSVVETHQTTPNTSLTEGGVFKKPRKDGGSRKRR